MDRQTSFIVSILASIRTALSGIYQASLRHLWCYLFGLQYLVYSGGANLGALWTEVYQNRARSEEVIRSLESSQSQLEGLHSQLSIDLATIKKQVSKIIFKDGAASGYFKAELIRLRDQHRENRQLLLELKNDTLQLRDDTLRNRTLLLRLHQIILQASLRQAQVRRDQARAFQEATQIEEVEEDPFRQVSPASAGPTLINDYSGNERPASTSPQGSPLSLEGEQDSSEESEEEYLPPTPQTTDEDSLRVDRVVQAIIRADIQRVIDSDSSSSPSPSDYLASDESDID